jgi:Lysophospholipase catalytic domain
MYNPYSFAVNGKVVGDKSQPDGPILRLNDDAMDQQNVPLAPLLYRSVDIIIANDNSRDTINMRPNTSLYRTMLWARKNNLAFPNVPSPEVMMSNNMNTIPAFYRCNSTTSPLIIYIPLAAGIAGRMALSISILLPLLCRRIL